MRLTELFRRPPQPDQAPQLDLPLFDAAPEPPQPLPAGTREIMLDGALLRYQFKRSHRKSIGFTVGEAGLSVTAPKWVTLADVDAAIVAKRKWIATKLHQQRERGARQIAEPEWRDGTRLPYLGQALTIVLASPSGSLQHDETTATLALGLPDGSTAQQIKDRVQAWLQQRAAALFVTRLDHYAQQLGCRYSGFALSSATGRWGSCTSAGKIRLNWRLIHFPLSVIDYVVAHELSHLHEMNHGPRFWQTVESIFPEYTTARDALKHHPPEQLPAF